VKLRRLDGDNARRVAVAARYDEALRGSARIAPPARAPGCDHVYHQYVVRSADRTALQARLREAGIGTNIHYPVPIHLQPAYRDRVALAPDGLAQTERAAREVLSLPMYPQLSPTQLDDTCAVLRRLA
jgi:dTDP-4-amino-4,6-dideoxygalactose transaminase